MHLRELDVHRRPLPRGVLVLRALLEAMDDAPIVAALRGDALQRLPRRRVRRIDVHRALKTDADAASLLAQWDRPIPGQRLAIDPAKREAAITAGAAAVIDGKAPDAAQQIIAMTNGGAWAVIDLVGSSATARLGIDSLIKGGKYIIVGLYGGDITLPLPPLPMRAITIQGSYVGSLPEMRELIDLVRRTGLPPVPVATRPLNDVNAVMDQLRAGKVVGRVVLTPA